MLQHDLPRARDHRPAWRDEMLAVGQLPHAAGGRIDQDQLAVHAHVDVRDDRAAVRRPGRLLDGVGIVGGQHQPRRAAGGRHDEQRPRVVRLHPLVRVGDEQHLRVVRRQLDAALLDGIVAGQRAGVLAAGVHHPHFAARGVGQER